MALGHDFRHLHDHECQESTHAGRLNHGSLRRECHQHTRMGHVLRKLPHQRLDRGELRQGRARQPRRLQRAVAECQEQRGRGRLRAHTVRPQRREVQRHRQSGAAAVLHSQGRCRQRGRSEERRPRHHALDDVQSVPEADRRRGEGQGCHTRPGVGRLPMLLQWQYD